MELHAMKEAHEVEVEKLINQAIFKEIKVNDRQTALTRVWGELELERIAKVEVE